MDSAVPVALIPGNSTRVPPMKYVLTLCLLLHNILPEELECEAQMHLIAMIDKVKIFF